MRTRRTRIGTDKIGLDEYDVGTSTGRPSSSSRSGRGLLRNPLVIVAMVVVGLYATMAAVLNVVVDTDQVRGWIAPRASALLNRPVSTGDARVALLPRPSIHVSDVRVDNLDGFDGPALAFVERVRLDVRMLPLLIGRVNVHRVHLDAPRVYLGIDEAGASNFGDLVPGSDAATEALRAPVSLGVEGVGVSDASVSYFNAPAARSFTVSGGDARVRLGTSGAAGWRADISVESDSLLARMATLTDEILHLEGPEVSLTARSEGGGRPINIENGVVELSGETLALNGRLTGLAGPRPSYDLQLTNDDMEADVLAALLPKGTRSSLLPVTDGRLGVTFQLTGARSPGRRPVVRGSLHLEDVSLRMRGQAMLEGVTGTVAVTPETIVLDSLTGRFADGPFELSGTVTRDTRMMAIRTRARPNLDVLDRLGLVPDALTVSGDAALDLSLAGPLNALDSVEVAGGVTLEGLQAKHARLGVPLYVPAGELTILAREVTWAELPVLVGQEEVVTSGRVTGLIGLDATSEPIVPELHASIRGARLNLGALFPADDDTPDETYAQLAFAHLGDRRLDGRPASTVMDDKGLSRPKTLPVRGVVSLELDTLDFRDYHLESVSARIELADSTLSVEAPAFTVWGGTVAGSLRLGVGEGPAQPFTLSMVAEGASAEALLAATTPVGNAVTGVMDVELDLTGTVDADLLPVGEDLAGRARLSITDGRMRDTGPNLVVADFLGSDEWRDVAFTSWDTELEIAAHRLEVRMSELTSDQGRVAFAGLVHLDGSHDLSLGLSIPPNRLRSVSLRRTGIAQSVLDHLSAAGSSLDLGLRMSGGLSAPQLEPDASNAVALARS